MQTGQRIWKDCDICNGTGKMYDRDTYAYDQSTPPNNSSEGYQEVPCHACNGLGIRPWGWLRDEKETTMPGEET